jgi:hypothetical protein
MTEDKIIWNGVRERMTSTMSNKDFKIMCKLHSEPCTCNKRILRRWIEELNDKLV